MMFLSYHFCVLQQLQETKESHLSQEYLYLTIITRQARTLDFSQGGARFRARREKFFFAPPWNCFVQKVN